jgi:hypothetical protein
MTSELDCVAIGDGGAGLPATGMDRAPPRTVENPPVSYPIVHP